MVDFDLRKLSAPLEELRPEVMAAYKRLDSKWNAIAAQLAKLPIPCMLGYSFQNNPHGRPEYTQLEWRKWRGKKRFCITFYGMEMDSSGDYTEIEEVTPYEEWSAEQRIEMLQHVPGLFNTAVNQVKGFIDKTRDKEVSE